jgi:hypothetical protein
MHPLICVKCWINLSVIAMHSPACQPIKDKIGLIRHFASFRPDDILNTLASAKSAMRALARRWLLLHDEILSHDKELELLVTKRAPFLMQPHGIATMIFAKMLILVGARGSFGPVAVYPHSHAHPV